MSWLDLLVVLSFVVVMVLLLLSAYALTVVAWTLVITGVTFAMITLIARWWVARPGSAGLSEQNPGH